MRVSLFVSRGSPRACHQKLLARLSGRVCSGQYLKTQTGGVFHLHLLLYVKAWLLVTVTIVTQKIRFIKIPSSVTNCMLYSQVSFPSIPLS